MYREEKFIWFRYLIIVAVFNEKVFCTIRSSWIFFLRFPDFIMVRIKSRSSQSPENLKAYANLIRSKKMLSPKLASENSQIMYKSALPSSIQTQNRGRRVYHGKPNHGIIIACLWQWSFKFFPGLCSSSPRIPYWTLWKLLYFRNCHYMKYHNPSNFSGKNCFLSVYANTEFRNRSCLSQ